MRLWIVSAFLLVALGGASDAFSHGRLTEPLPRTNSDGIKTGPCGGAPKGAPKATWTAGTVVTVRWEETIDHPGRYILSLSPANDVGFQQNVINANFPDMQNPATLPHKYAYSFVVPNTPGETWTLQWIQSMEENPASPSYYYSCADIRIVAAGGATPTPTPTPTPRPTATPPGATPTPMPTATPPGNGGGGGTPTPVPGPGTGTETSQSSTGQEFQKPAMASCGLVAGSGRGGPRGPFGGGPMIGLLLTLPLACLLALRQRKLQLVGHGNRVAGSK